MARFLSLVCFLFCIPPMVANADFPDNNLDKQDAAIRKNLEKREMRATKTEEKFNYVIDSLERIYKPIIEAFGAKFVVERDWNDSTVNAWAAKYGKNWTVHMYGGFFRRPEITEDSFALVMCHEIHHLVGGMAFYSGSDMSAEGQADYAGNHVCARKLFLAAPLNTLGRTAQLRSVLPQSVVDKCSRAWSKDLDRAVCLRSAKAGLELANVLGVMEGRRVSFDTPDNSVVREIYESHPRAQSRLDTYLAGSLCTKFVPDNIIPGLLAAVGYNSYQNEKASEPYNCYGKEDARPASWFKSFLK